MPKMKTHSGAKKRFEVSAGGKLRGRHAFTSHILEKKSPKRKRALGRPAAISVDDSPRVRRMLGVTAKGAPGTAQTKPAGGTPKAGGQ